MSVHLHVHSAFSFLDGCSYPEAIVKRAGEYGYEAIALTDHDNLCGAIRFVKAAREAGIKPILGAELSLQSRANEQAGPNHITLLAATSHGYQNLCRLITLGYEYGGRRTPATPAERLFEHSQGLIALSGCRKGEISRLLLEGRRIEARQTALEYRRIFGDRFFIELQRLFLPHERRLLSDLCALADELKIPVAATNNVHYLDRDDLPTHDILTCCRTLTKVDEPHPLRPLNAEQFLLPPQLFYNRFRTRLDALTNTDRIAATCDDNVLDMARPDIPTPAICEGTPAQFLRKLTYQGARQRYGKLTPVIEARLNHELRIIGRLRCESYFLVVWDIVREAKLRGIRTSGRGSVVDCAVGHCLGISDIDPIGANLRFERFMSLERSQMPDIDIDFPREQRDELVTWVQERYGVDHVGAVCTFSTFRARSALREIGKAMELPEDEIGLLARRLRSTNADEIAEQMEKQPQAARQRTSAKRYEHLFAMCARVAGLPRMISTHLCGIVITTHPILNYTPLQPTAKGIARIAHFDKDDIEYVGLKMDLLSLPILEAVDQAKPVCRFESIPHNDPTTFEMIRSGQAVGAFELQSPAQRALHVRVKTDSMKDIIDSIALIRPGPGMGGMVDTYIRRKLGLEPVEYMHPALEEPLKHTFGVIIFQEQVIEVACAAAKLTPGEADILRKMITHARSKKAMEELRGNFIRKALANGVERDTAEKVFKCVAGFAGYGFAEGHARAFGEIAYKSAYLLNHHPAHYLAGLLNNQPMGFYPPNTIVSQARNRGILILPLDINESHYLATSTDDAIRIGFRQARGLSDTLGRRIHSEAPFNDIRDFCERCHPAMNELEALIIAGAFDSLHPHRRALLWQSEAISKLAQRKETLRLLDIEPDSILPGQGTVEAFPDFTEAERLSMEYSVLGLNPNCHLVSLLRPKLDSYGLLTTADLAWIPGGQKVRVGGLTICPHTPPTKSGTRVLFFCLEDEFGLIDVTCFEDIYRSSGYLAFSEPVVIVEGTLQKRNLGRALLADRIMRVPQTLSREAAVEKVFSLSEPKTHSIAR
ncbi:MAG: DNA polymerase III subunit alpha [Armatimonadetes bacterium]|nr:DNA polymerase III subunit alpha [Armatimonadota bacterium]